MLLRLFLVLMLASAAQVQAAPRIVLDPGTHTVPLAGRMEWLRDTPGQLDAAQAQAASGWQRLAADPGFGFTPAAIWLRFEVEQPREGRASWRLEVNNALLEDVRLYLPAPGGGWTAWQAGRSVPHSEWPLDTRSPVFRLDLPPGTHPVLVRLATRNSLSTSMTLWESERFYARARNEALLWGGYFGLYALVILIQFVFWRWTREALSGWYVPYAILNCLGVLMSTGYLQDALNWHGPVATTVLGLVICAVLYVGAKFSSVQLGLDQVMPRFNRVGLNTMALLSLVTSGLVLAGHYAAGVVAAQALSLALLLGLTGVALDLWRRGHAPARFFLAIFGLFYLGVAVRYARNLGWLAPGFITDYSIQIGSVVHLIVMCLFIVHRFNAVRRALRIEQSARQEQRDFVAMVSHEYRTPLAIISTSVQQLAANLDAPLDKTLKRCANIRQATQRMTELLDTYLSAERLDEASQSLQLQACDPREVIEEAAGEWSPERLRLSLHQMPASLLCDRSLLRVALRNLLANAHRHAAPDTAIELVASGGGGGLHVSVTNQGDVIAPDELPLLFRRYFRGRASRGQPGAGLGLYLVKRIAEQHRGRVGVRSEQGQTAFELWLPLGQPGR